MTEIMEKLVLEGVLAKSGKDTYYVNKQKVTRIYSLSLMLMSFLAHYFVTVYFVINVYI